MISIEVFKIYLVELVKLQSTHLKKINHLCPWVERSAVLETLIITFHVMNNTFVCFAVTL
jgi:hypothetical protein